MLIEIQPLDNDVVSADTIWQLAAYALGHSRVRLVFEDGDGARRDATREEDCI